MSRKSSAESGAGGGLRQGDEPAVARRRLVTAVVLTAVAGAIAVAIALLTTRSGDTDTGTGPAPPTLAPTPSVAPTAVPTPSVAPTEAPTPTLPPTRAASPSVDASPAPPSSPVTTPSDGWSAPVVIAGRSYRVRLVPSKGGDNYDVELRAGATTVFTPDAVYNTEGQWGVDASDPHVAYHLGGVRLTDLVSVKGRPVDDEVVGHVQVRAPEGRDVTGGPYVDLVITVFRTTSPNVMAAGGPDGWVVRFADGSTWDLAGQ